MTVVRLCDLADQRARRAPSVDAETRIERSRRFLIAACRTRGATVLFTRLSRYRPVLLR